MKHLQAYVEQELYWEQTCSISNSYRLLAGDEVLAKLDVDGLGKDAKAEAAEGCFSIVRIGFFNIGYHIFLSRLEQAVYTPGWSIGTLRLNNGSIYIWEGISFSGGEYVWMDNFGEPLIRFQSSSGENLLHIVIKPTTAPIPDLSLLAILGCYLKTLKQHKENMIHRA